MNRVFFKLCHIASFALKGLNFAQIVEHVAQSCDLTTSAFRSSVHQKRSATYKATLPSSYADNVKKIHLILLTGFFSSSILYAIDFLL